MRPASLLPPLEPGCQLWGGWWLSGLTSDCISGQEKDREPVEPHIPLEMPKNTSWGKAGGNLAQCFGESVSGQRDGKHGAACLLPSHWFLFGPPQKTQNKPAVGGAGSGWVLILFASSTPSSLPTAPPRYLDQNTEDQASVPGAAVGSMQRARAGTELLRPGPTPGCHSSFRLSGDHTCWPGTRRRGSLPSASSESCHRDCLQCGLCYSSGR